MSKNKYREALEYGLSLYLTDCFSVRAIARYVVKVKNLDIKPNSFRGYLENHIKEYIGNRKDVHKALAEECEIVGIPLDKVSNYWYKGQHFSIFAKNDQPMYNEIRDELLSEMEKYSPVYPKIDRTYLEYGTYLDDESYLLVIDPADIHIGKLAVNLVQGEEHNNELIVKRVMEGVTGIVNKARGYRIDKILLIVGNDVLHVDNENRTTNKGTKQDTDGMWYDNYQIAKKLYVDIIESLIPYADVHVQFNPSNHDFTNGFFLCDTVMTWFRNCENVTFDADMTNRKYFRYHNNLIGSTHGDTAKKEKLPLLMAHEAKEMWGETKHKYFYIHHGHRKVSEDYGPVNVEMLRSPSGTDMWHHKHGYSGNPKAIEGFIHSKEHGQVARLTHIF